MLETQPETVEPSPPPAVPAPNPNAGRNEQIAALWNQNWSLTQIASKLRISRSVASGVIHRLGLFRNRPRLPKPERRVRGDAGGGVVRRIRAKAAPQRESRRKIEPHVEAPAEFLGIHLLDLQSDMCRWPEGEGSAIRFCGQRATHQSYCAEHHARAQRKPGEA